MEWGDPRTVKRKSIVAPGDLRMRMAQSHVIALAETFRRLGKRAGNRCWVTKVRHGWKLHAGRDRYAAYTLNDVDDIPVEVIASATPEELADLEEVENLYRRPVADRDKLIAAHVQRIAARIEASRSDAARNSDTGVSKPGRPKSPEGEAREQLAAAMGTTPGAVKEAMRREKVREEGAARLPTDASGTNSEGCTRPGPPPPIETFGNALPPRVLENVAPVLTVLRALKSDARNMALAAARLGATTFDGGAAGRIQEAVRNLAAMLSGLTPTHGCPYCIRAGSSPTCRACGGAGYVTAAVFKSAPAELRGGLEVVADETHTSEWAANVVAEFDKTMRAAGLDAEPAQSLGGDRSGSAPLTGKASNPTEKNGAPARGTGAGAPEVAAKTAMERAPGPRREKSRGGIQFDDGPVRSVAEVEAELAKAEGLPF